MSENIEWLDVVLDYGKRFPDVTMRDIGINAFFNCKFGSLVVQKNSHNNYKILTTLAHDGVFSTYLSDGLGYLECYTYVNSWERVPDHILLRLLTEGKEDLI